MSSQEKEWLITFWWSKKIDNSDTWNWVTSGCIIQKPNRTEPNRTQNKLAKTTLLAPTSPQGIDCRHVASPKCSLKVETGTSSHLICLLLLLKGPFVYPWHLVYPSGQICTLGSYLHLGTDRLTIPFTCIFCIASSVLWDWLIDWLIGMTCTEPSILGQLCYFVFIHVMAFVVIEYINLMPLNYML